MEAPDQRPSKPEARPSGEDTARESTTAPESPSYRAFWLAALLILLAAFALRVVALMGYPLFYDEALHILRAHSVMDGYPLVGVRDQKWLFTVALAFFQPSGPESAWLGRILSALTASATISVAIALGRHVGRQAGDNVFAWQVGLTAGLTQCCRSPSSTNARHS